MKKTYIQPSIEVYKIETANMIAGSKDPRVTLDRNATGISAESVGSRGGSDWDDED